MDKKAQAEVLLNWFIAIAVIFLMVIFTLIWLGKPWQKVDSSLSPMIDNTYCDDQGTCAGDLPQQFRRNQGLVPVIMIFAVILIAFLSGIRRDPNVPYGPY